MEYPRWMEASGTPQEYFQIGHDLIGLFRAPASSSDVLEITAVVIPGPYADGERLKLKESYQWAAVHYAVAEFWAGRGDATEAAKSFGYYAEASGLMDKQSLFKSRVFVQKTDETTA
jgi:hypothetical protein